MNESIDQSIDQSQNTFTAPRAASESEEEHKVATLYGVLRPTQPQSQREGK